MSNKQAVEKGSGLVRGLNLVSATTMVVGSMIGSGIFIVPSIMAGYVRSPGLIILLWVLGGIFTLFGSLSYAELSAAMPKAGGQYVFLREAYSRFWSFLFGWALLTVIQTGLIAAVGVAFAKYLGVFIPGISEKSILFSAAAGGFSFSINSAQLVGIASVVLLTAINYRGIKAGALVQNIFTFLKVGAIVILVVLAFALGKGSFSNLTAVNPLVPETVKMTFLLAVAVALSKALFGYDGWTTVTFAAEEVENPQKNLPLALIFGALIVTGVYALTVAAYFYLIPIHQAASIPDNRIAASAAQIIFGSAGTIFISAAILISTFGCNNGLILGGARVYYAMSKDRMFLRRFARIHPKFHTPGQALIWQAVWASILTLSGTYSDLLTYIAFASVLFNGMTVVGLFILRRKRPDMEREHLTIGYPWVPAIYVIMALAFMIFILRGDPVNSLKGLGLIVLGIPFYYLFEKRYNGANLTE